MPGKKRSGKEVLLMVIGQEVLERKRYERQIGVTNSRDVRDVLECLRKTEEEHARKAVGRLRELEPGFVLNEEQFAGGKISGIFLLDEKEFYFEEKLLDLNVAKDVRFLLEVIDTDVKREAYVARLYASLAADATEAATGEMLKRFVSDEKVHLEKLRALGERIRLLHAGLLEGDK